MTPREKFLATVLLVFVGILLAGVLGYFLVYDPMVTKNKELLKVESDILTKQTQLMGILQERKLYEAKRQQSLPADVGAARESYQRLLSGLLRKADFSASTTNLVPKTPDNKTTPTIAPKKPAYTKLEYTIDVRGEEKSLVTFLELFYKQPLLHSIRKMTVKRSNLENTRTTSITSKSSKDSARTLEITMEVEAIVLENADNRGTLLPVSGVLGMAFSGVGAVAHTRSSVENNGGSQFLVADISANPPRDYRTIAWKDIFYGPTKVEPERPKKEKVEEKKEIKKEEKKEEKPIPPGENYLPYIVLTAAFAEADGRCLITLFDRANKHEYNIMQSPTGEIEVESFRYEKNTRVPLHPTGPYIIVGSREKNNLARLVPRKLTALGMYVEPVDDDFDKRRKAGMPPAFAFLGPLFFPNEVRFFTVGESLSQGEPLTTREARRALMPTPPEDSGR